MPGRQDAAAGRSQFCRFAKALAASLARTDLIAQAERMYYTQNGNYADLPTLVSNGTMNIARTSRGGYNYSVETTAGSFSVTVVSPPEIMHAGVWIG